MDLDNCSEHRAVIPPSPHSIIFFYGHRLSIAMSKTMERHSQQLTEVVDDKLRVAKNIKQA